MVVRRDARHHAQWFEHGVIQSTVGGRYGLAFKLVNKTRVIVDVRRCCQYIAAHFLDRVATIGRVEPGKVINMQPQPTRDFAHHRSLFGSRYACPLQKSPMRGLDRGVDVAGVRHSHVGQYLLIGRVVCGLVTAGRFVPGATVVQIKVFRHNPHGVSRHFFHRFVVSHQSLHLSSVNSLLRPRRPTPSVSPSRSNPRHNRPQPAHRARTPCLRARPGARRQSPAASFPDR